MPTYALISGGQFVGTRHLTEAQIAGSAIGYRAEKPYLLPYEESQPNTFDEATEVLEGPSVSIEADRCLLTYTKRAKTGADLDAMKADLDARIEAEFRRRSTAPLPYLGHEWHAADDAVTNILGVLKSYDELERMGQPVPPTRTWTPRGQHTGVEVTRDQLAVLGITMAQRKDALFTVKKAKQAAVWESSSASFLASYDPAAGWDG